MISVSKCEDILEMIMPHCVTVGRYSVFQCHCIANIAAEKSCLPNLIPSWWVWLDCFGVFEIRLSFSQSLPKKTYSKRQQVEL